jgi:hypothetical protein
MAPSNLSSPKSRGSHARAILGPKLHDRLPSVKVLIVGAGGIGCELRMRIPFRQMRFFLTTGDYSEERRACRIRAHYPARSGHHRPFQPEPSILVPKEGREAEQSLGMPPQTTLFCFVVVRCKRVSSRWPRAQHPRSIPMFTSLPFMETSRTRSLTWRGFKALTSF